MGVEMWTRAERDKELALVLGRKDTAESATSRIMNNVGAWILYYGTADGSMLIQDFGFLIGEVKKLREELTAARNEIDALREFARERGYEVEAKS